MSIQAKIYILLFNPKKVNKLKNRKNYLVELKYEMKKISNFSLQSNSICINFWLSAFWRRIAIILQYSIYLMDDIEIVSNKQKIIYVDDLEMFDFRSIN